MRSSSMVVVCLSLVHATAFADGTGYTAPPPTVATTPVVVVAPTPVVYVPPPPSEVRLRNGFSFSAGQEYGSGPSSGLSGQLYGGDWRIGARITEHYAVYLHSHLSFGTAHIGAASGVTGNLAAAVLAERTLPARIFVAGGGGYGVLNNPHGPLGQLRLGWYPMKHAPDKVARRLNVAFDARWYFAGENIGTVTQLAVTLGYDRF